MGFFDKLIKKRRLSIFDASVYLSPQMVSNALHCADEIIKYMKIDKNSDSGALYFAITVEFVYLFLCITDISAYRVLDANIRNELITLLTPTTLEGLCATMFKPALNEMHKKELLKNMIATYNDRMSSYANYIKLLPDKNKAPTNTIIYEFAKVLIEEIINTDNPEALILLITKLSSDSITSINVDDILRQVR